MAGRLHGKTAIVTSAGQGIGRASAICLAKEGAKVWATDINAEALTSLAAEQAGIETFTLDVLKQDEVDAAAKRVGTPDILFNCSGYVHAGTIMETDDKAWDFSFDLNVKAHYRMMKAFMPGWLARGQRRRSSTWPPPPPRSKGVPNRFVYGATKAAVIGMTKALAADFTSKGIRVNAICPGTVDSPSLTERLKATGDYEARQVRLHLPPAHGPHGPCRGNRHAGGLSGKRRGGLRHRPDLRDRRRLVDLAETAHEPAPPSRQLAAATEPIGKAGISRHRMQSNNRRQARGRQYILAAGQTAIEAKGVTKLFQGAGQDAVKALDNVSVSIRENEFFTLLGPSGCGKTTLLRLIAGFDFPTEGEILLYGEDIAPLPPFKRPVNTVFQSYALFPAHDGRPEHRLRPRDAGQAQGRDRRPRRPRC